MAADFLLTLRPHSYNFSHFLGHDVVAVIGTATAQAGDPSEHTKDRSILTQEEINHNAKLISDQINFIANNHAEHIYDTRGKKILPKFTILHNHTWYNKLNSIDFISKICRNFRMGPMMGKCFAYQNMQ